MQVKQLQGKMGAFLSTMHSRDENKSKQVVNELQEKLKEVKEKSMQNNKKFDEAYDNLTKEREQENDEWLKVMSQAAALPLSKPHIPQLHRRGSESMTSTRKKWGPGTSPTMPCSRSSISAPHTLIYPVMII